MNARTFGNVKFFYGFTREFGFFDQLVNENLMGAFSNVNLSVFIIMTVRNWLWFLEEYMPSSITVDT